MHPKDVLFHHANYFDIWKESMSDLNQPVHFVHFGEHQFPKCKIWGDSKCILATALWHDLVIILLGQFCWTLGWQVILSKCKSTILPLSQLHFGKTTLAAITQPRHKYILNLVGIEQNSTGPQQFYQCHNSARANLPDHRLSWCSRDIIRLEPYS